MKIFANLMSLSGRRRALSLAMFAVLFLTAQTIAALHGVSFAEETTHSDGECAVCLASAPVDGPLPDHSLTEQQAEWRVVDALLVDSALVVSARAENRPVRGPPAA